MFHVSLQIVLCAEVSIVICSQHNVYSVHNGVSRLTFMNLMKTQSTSGAECHYLVTNNKEY